MWDACPWLRDIIFYVVPLPRALQDIQKYATAAFLERFQRGPGGATRDLFTYLLGEDKDTGIKLNATQLGNDSFALVIGGSDTEVAGRFIPEFTTVRHPAYCIMRDAANFSPAPTKFRPDRWLAPEDEEAFNLKAYYPFNVGSHRCIGERLALQEVRYTIAATVLKYEMHLAPGFDVDKFYHQSCMDAFFFSFDDPINVVLKARKGVDCVFPDH
ncbi:hypothetical protein RQP46_011249 [Phenoliferia psychrophenolica]